MAEKILSSTSVVFSVCFVISSVCISWFGLMRGKCPPTKIANVLLRCYFLFFQLFLASQVKSVVWITFLLLWAPLYLDLSEHHWGATTASSALKLPKVWKWVRDYLKPRVVKTVDIKEQCVFGLHPHGLAPVAGVLNTSRNNADFDEKFPEQNKRVILAASSCFVFFLFRELLISAGVLDCSPFNFESWLNQGYSVFIFPGGAHEGLYGHPHVDRLDLIRKRGFIRLAMKRGVNVVPCYTFNEVDGWDQLSDKSFGPVARSIRWVFNRFWGLTLPIVTNFLPNWAPSTLVTVIGAPIELPHDMNPSEETLSRYSSVYMDALSKLYNKHAPMYNTQQRKMEIVT